MTDIHEALVAPHTVYAWACQGGQEHPTTVWLRKHLNPRRLCLVRRLGVVRVEDADNYGVLLVQLQVCGTIVDLEVFQDHWSTAACMSQIRARACLN